MIGSGVPLLRGAETTVKPQLCHMMFAVAFSVSIWMCSPTNCYDTNCWQTVAYHPAGPEEAKLS